MRRWYRPTNLVARALGLILLIPGLLQVPLPQADFHIIRHHHGAGEVCLQHDHLLKWHPQAEDGEGVAVLHWHWLPPRSLDPSLLDQDARMFPALHAHEVDAPQPDLAVGPIFTRDNRGRDDVRDDLAASLRVAPGEAAWTGLASPFVMRSAFCAIAPDELAPATLQPRLVRWNC